MSNAKCCDRCGHFYFDNKKTFEYGGKIIPTKIKVVNYNEAISLDFCDYCIKDFENFLKFNIPDHFAEMMTPPTE